MYSESPLAADGGDLGEFEVDSLAAGIQEAITELGQGEFTQVLETEQGYQIFYIESVTPGESIPLLSASAEIEEKLFNEIVNEKYTGWLEDLRGKAHIKIMQQ